MDKVWILWFAFYTLILTTKPTCSQPGFINIDCGGTTNYTDGGGVHWISDDGYITTGEKISLLKDGEMVENNIPHTTLRRFPEGVKNCYEVRPVVIGHKYLFRAAFYYNNYDNLNSPPTFYLILDTSIWDSVKFLEVNEQVTLGGIIVAKFNPTNVCVAKGNGTGIPFISSIELRPMENNMYWPANQNFLMSIETYNFGVPNTSHLLRYPDDPFDRLWPASDLGTNYTISTDKDVSTGISYDRPPSKVMQTAATSSLNSSSTLDLPEIQIALPGNLYIAIYFAEVENSSITREFDLYLDDQKLYGPIKPKYLQSSNVSILKFFGGSALIKLSLRSVQSSSFPIVNALETYRQGAIYQNGTDPSDSKALAEIQRILNFKYLSAGDPCLPFNFSWDWLSCSSNSVPRIISLQLSNRSLSGTIPSSISNLQELVALDLSDNKLTGTIPESLVTLPHLQELNLKNNELQGSVPDSLLKKKGLTLRLSGNSLNCQGKGTHCHDSYRVKAIVLGLTIPGLFVTLLLVAVTLFVMHKRRNVKRSIAEDTSTSMAKKIKYNEVIRMTDHFSNQIGQGGFGAVFYGHLPNGKEVAVKVLSDSSKQGRDEFKVEVSLLSRLHHKNLLDLVGYCCESEHCILIYEYIARGSLNKLLRSDVDAELLLHWEHRIGIALGAAQGLEYLHNGCRPSVIHRDVKSSNILINTRMEAKVSDFGLSRDGPETDKSQVTTEVKGTIGYLDPQYVTRRALTQKSDVYSFGVVLFELITGKQVIDPNAETDKDDYVVSWARSILASGETEELIDKRAKGHISKPTIWKFAALALACTEQNGDDRPTMSEVVIELEETYRMVHNSALFNVPKISSTINEISSMPTPR